MTRQTFRAYLKQLVGEDTPLGDLADDALASSWQGDSLLSFERHFYESNPHPLAEAAFKEARQGYKHQD